MKISYIPLLWIHSPIVLNLAICCILIAIYNSSLRMEAGYMAYFVLALPFVESAKPQGDVVENNLKQTFESQETLVGGRRRRFR